MKRFEFRLEGLLRIRRVEEERCLKELRERQGAMAAKQQEIDAILLEKTRQIEQLRSLESGPLSIDELLAHRRYLNSLNKSLLEKEAELPALYQGILEAQKLANAAARERKVIERLRERRYSEYLEEARRQESAELDEMTQVRAGTLRQGRPR